MYQIKSYVMPQLSLKTSPSK